MYDFEPEKVRQFLESHNVRRAAIQLPPGLRRNLREIIRTFKEAEVEAVVLSDSCYGACDLADVKAKRLGCDALVHYGHADMGLRTVLPTLFVEARMKIDPRGAIELALPELEGKRWGVATTVQHIEHLPRIVKFLADNGIESVIGNPGPRARYPGQVLGCDWGCVRSIAGEIDGVLYVGTGRFHPLGMVLATGKEVVAANPISGSYERVRGFEDFIKKRAAVVGRASSYEDFYVVSSVKPGQRRLGLARKVVRELRQNGLNAELLVADEITPETVEDFPEGGVVSVACPRIPIDDVERFKRPVLTPFEARVMMGKAELEPYELDEIKEGDA